MAPLRPNDLWFAGDASNGATIREAFAVAIMASMCVNRVPASERAPAWTKQIYDEQPTEAEFAEEAVRLADALVSALNRKYGA